MVRSRTEFERQLAAIRAMTGELFGMITEDLPKATEALLDGGGAAPEVLAEREQAVDSLSLEVVERVGREILLEAPVASDLRFLLSVMRIAPEIERSHDLVMQIAAAAGRVGDDLSPPVRELARRMADLASSMWRQAGGCWPVCDRAAAMTLDEPIAELGKLHERLTAELATGRMTVPTTMEMTVVARLYDRLGAHAVNIARREAHLAGGRALLADRPPGWDDGQE